MIAFDSSVSQNMRDVIETMLRDIESRENVRIIFAIESGSRAWGFPSPDSDYDVRFVYAHPVDWYLSIVPGRDVIELPINEELDINGWDLRKALGLMIKPNPVLLEWLSSPLRYRWDSEICSRLVAFSRDIAHGASCLNHYLSLADKQWRAYIENKVRVSLKKYFYVLRPAMAIRWIRMNPDIIPPMNFQELAAGIDIDAALQTQLDYLLIAKSRTKEIGEGPRITEIDAFIERELRWARAAVKDRSEKSAVRAEESDALFREILLASAG